MTLVCEIHRRADRAVLPVFEAQHHHGQYCAYLESKVLLETHLSSVVTMRNIEPAR